MMRNCIYDKQDEVDTFTAEAPLSIYSCGEKHKFSVDARSYKKNMFSLEGNFQDDKIVVEFTHGMSCIYLIT